jgi:hypothetical protein
MKKNHFISGEFNLLCDVCSKKIKAHESRQRWDGFIVCKDDWEIRHEQDFVRARQDKITIPFQRPNYNPEYTVCTLTGISSVAGYAVAGCMVAGTLPFGK